MNTTQRGPVDSTNPLIAKLNAIVYKAFPPKWHHPARAGTYGRLYYLGDGMQLVGHSFFPQWMLDGMTPVTADFVIRELESLGYDMSEFDSLKTKLGRLAFPHT